MIQCCWFCRDEERVMNVKGYPVCESCFKKIDRIVEEEIEIGDPWVGSNKCIDCGEQILKLTSYGDLGQYCHDCWVRNF